MKHVLMLVMGLAILTSCATYVPDTNNALGRCMQGSRWDSFQDAAPANKLVITKLEDEEWDYRITNAQGCSYLFKIENNIIADTENIGDPVTCLTTQSVIDNAERCAKQKGN
ncbi:MAG: hypothetical protein KQI78_12270 [Deltaproteobacteria bacterium]|nr:hypothetical protein [Deltaproteobacteria bacterium]